MNAAAIVYTSQTGFTARYAALLAERTGLPCRPLKEAAALPRGTAVIYLGWLCAGGIKGLKGARRRFRTAAVCAVGMAAEVEEASCAGTTGWRAFPCSTSGAATPRRSSPASTAP